MKYKEAVNELTEFPYSSITREKWLNLKLSVISLVDGLTLTDVLKRTAQPYSPSNEDKNAEDWKIIDLLYYLRN